MGMGRGGWRLWLLDTPTFLGRSRLPLPWKRRLRVRVQANPARGILRKTLTPSGLAPCTAPTTHRLDCCLVKQAGSA